MALYKTESDAGAVPSAACAVWCSSWPDAPWARSTRGRRCKLPPLTRNLLPGIIRRPNNGKQPSRTTAQLAESGGNVFHDSQLNALEEKADTSNQNIAAAVANFFAARTVIREARSQYFPTLATNPSIMNARPSAGQFGGLRSGSSSSLRIHSHFLHGFLGARRRLLGAGLVGPCSQHGEGNHLCGPGERRRLGKCAPLRRG